MWRYVVASVMLLTVVVGSWLAYGWLFPTYTITREMRVGEQWRYQFVQSFQKGQEALTLNLQYTETVRKVNPDGSAVVERVLHADPQTLDALRQSAGPLGKILTRTLWQVHSDGRETSLSGERAQLAFGSASAQILPLRPVRIGERWERESEVGSIKTRFLCRLERIVNVDGAPCYQISAQLQSLPGSLPQVQGSLTSYIDRQTGWVRKEEGTITMTAGSLQMSSQISLHGQRVREGTSRRGAKNG